MSTTVQDIISQINVKLGDQKDTLFSESSKILQINDSLQDIVSETKCHVRQATIRMRDRRTVYDFPEDMLEPVNITFYKLRGDLVYNGVYQNTVMNNESFNGTNTLGQLWHAPGASSFHGTGAGVRGSGHQQFREIVSDSQFILDPVVDAEMISPDNPQVVEFGP